MTTRRSVPTKGISRYWASNWSYIMPDFDVPNNSIIEWNGIGEPQEPEEGLLPHDYVPDASMYQGDCYVCGHARDSLIHKAASDDAEKLAADVLAEFLGANV